MQTWRLTAPGLILALAVSGCATMGSAAFEGTERTAEACDVECQLIVSNVVGRTLLISVYQGGMPRFVGAVDGGRSETFQVMRNLTSDRIVVVAELDGKDYCRGSVDLPPDRPARFTVGDRVDCKQRP